MKDRMASIAILIMFNILAYALLNNEAVPHISPKFASWAVGLFDGILIMWLYLNIKLKNI